VTTRAEPEPEAVVRVSTLELFFDLVFVFTLTRLTESLAHHLTVVGLVQVILMLGVILWMYGGYAWLTNAVAPTTRFRRTLFLVGMAGFLGISLAIPDAFGATGWLFGIGYFVVNAVHSGLFLAAGGRGAVRAMVRLAPMNLLSAGLVLVGGFLPEGLRYAAWGTAFVVMLASPYLNPINEFNISPSHFVERHGLLIIIALGESVVAIGVSAVPPIDVRLVTVAVLGLSLSYLMWWVYFGDDDDAGRAFAAVEPARRGRVAIEAYGWAHFGLLFGVVVVAAGMTTAVGHTLRHLGFAESLALGGGLAIYLFSDVAFRRILRAGSIRFRAAAGVLALALVPLGMLASAVLIAALIALLLAMLYVEAHWARPRSERS
jgi:low temperature requirement protein LtrA